MKNNNGMDGGSGGSGEKAALNGDSVARHLSSMASSWRGAYACFHKQLIVRCNSN